MTVLLILATFVVFLTIDYFHSRGLVVQPTAVAVQPPKARIFPDIVGGFELPASLHYHLGHTWALAESPNLIRVGMDDLAAHLVGGVERVTLPQRGRWVRQGQKLVTLIRDGAQADMVSPMEGMITDINEAVVRDPALALHDPYGQGWLVKMQAPDPDTNFRNLLGGAVARQWMEEAAHRLRMQLERAVTAPSFALAQDGGLALHDLTAQMPDKDWGEFVREYFLV